MYVFIFAFKVRYMYLSGHLSGNRCLPGLRHVFKYKYVIVNLVFFHLAFWSGNFFLIAPFPDQCLLVSFYDGPDLKLLILRLIKAGASCLLLGFY